MTDIRHTCDLPEIQSPNFFNGLANRPAETPLPLAATWELTTRCNLRCRHCYLPPASPTDTRLPLPDALRLLDTLAENEVLFLLLTGGELTLHPQWLDIYRHARHCGFLVTLMTNATRIDPALIRELRDLPPRRIETTIYGFTPATYDAVTGVPGAYTLFQKGVAQIRAAGLPLEIKMLVLQSNVHEFEPIRRWTADEGIPFRYDAIINPRLDGDWGPTSTRIPALTLKTWLKNYSPDSPACVKPQSPSSPPTRLFTCGAGTQTLHVDPAGQAHPCMMWRWDPLDTRAPGWARAWKNHIQNLRLAPAPGDSPCATCGHRSACFTCPALARLETGRAGQPVEYFCKLVGV